MLNSLAVQEISCHQELQSDLRRDRELWDLSGTICKAHFICEVHADFLQYV